MSTAVDAAFGSAGRVETTSAATARKRRPRLDHVDAMRPIKQGGVVATHALLFFAPPATMAVGAALLVTHVTRFAFMFISAAMLVYAYPALNRGGLRVFWRRRLLAVGLPYLTWTLVYFVLESMHIKGVPGAFTTTGGIVASIPVTLDHLGYLLLMGYFQLYYLTLLLEFYLFYPAFLWLLRRTAGHHGLLMAASAAVAVGLSFLVHWKLVPPWMQGSDATRELWNYQLYLIAGGVMAWHYDGVHNWLRAHRRHILLAGMVALAVGEICYVLASTRTLPFLVGAGSADAFEPIFLPLYATLILAVYLLGVFLANPKLPGPLRRLVRATADNSYGVYLSQVLFITMLSMLRWGRLENTVPWPLVVGGAVVLVYACSCILTALLSYLPGARATAGRNRRAWRATS